MEPGTGETSAISGAFAGVLRAVAWYALFILLQISGVLVLSGVPLRFEGKAVLLQSGVNLAAAVIAGLLLLRFDERPARDLGFGLSRRAMPEMAAGTGIGAAGLFAAALLMAAIGALRYHAEAGTIGAYFATIATDYGVLVVAAAAEEAMFRGYAFQIVAATVSPVAATLGGSVAFAWAHAGNPNVDAIAFANIFLAGILLSVAFLHTGSLWFATGVHVGWNWAMASLADLPVSGLELFNTPLYEPSLHGREWLTGGSFGPEGGLGGTIGFGIALVMVLLATRRWAGTTRMTGTWKRSSAQQS